MLGRLRDPGAARYFVSQIVRLPVGRCEGSLHSAESTLAEWEKKIPTSRDFPMDEACGTGGTKGRPGFCKLFRRRFRSVESRDQRVQARERRKPDLSGLTLLVVDDDDDSLQRLTAFLRSCGAVVLAARGGVRALAYLDTTDHVDVMVTDLSMPYMDGIELIQTVRAHRPRTSLPAIALSGLPVHDMDVRNAGFDAFLEKPVNFTALCTAIRSLVLMLGRLRDPMLRAIQPAPWRSTHRRA